MSLYSCTGSWTTQPVGWLFQNTAFLLSSADFSACLHNLWTELWNAAYVSVRGSYIAESSRLLDWLAAIYCKTTFGFNNNSDNKKACTSFCCVGYVSTMLCEFVAILDVMTLMVLLRLVSHSSGMDLSLSFLLFMDRASWCIRSARWLVGLLIVTCDVCCLYLPLLHRLSAYSHILTIFRHYLWTLTSTHKLWCKTPVDDCTIGLLYGPDESDYLYLSVV